MSEQVTLTQEQYTELSTLAAFIKGHASGGVYTAIGDANKNCLNTIEEKADKISEILASLSKV